jgi:Uncharacterized protein conserved in bacteria
MRKITTSFAPLVALASFAVIAIACACLASCNTTELKTVRAMPIRDIDLATVKDGVYEGEYAYGTFTYAVQVKMEGHAIAAIDVLKNRDTPHAKKAATVVQRVLNEQRTNVDAVSGATTTSKALLKAIEVAISKGSE